MKKAPWDKIMVVVANPFAERQLAVSKAAAIASRCGAEVVLFDSFMLPQSVREAALGSPESIIDLTTRQRTERLMQVAKQARLPRGTQCIVRWDFPIHEAIVRQVYRTKPDLLIAESHRHGRLARMVLANTDWQLIRDCPCPLWFVRTAELPREPRWLVAVDPRHTHAKPAELDDRLLSAAQGAVDRVGGTVSMVHAYELPLGSGPGTLVEPIRLPRTPGRGRKVIADTTRAIQALARKHGISRNQCLVREGAVTDVIAAEAERQHADVLVMGAVSRSLLERPVIGITAERVIDHVDCDVFVVKPSGFKSRVAKAVMGLAKPSRPRPGQPGARRTRRPAEARPLA